jgi:hypothetical protein
MQTSCAPENKGYVSDRSLQWQWKGKEKQEQDEVPVRRKRRRREGFCALQHP